MIFTSYTYLVFLLATFVVHWSLPSSWRKVFLILASYVFYCTWKWQFGFLLLGVSLFNWTYARYVLAQAHRMSWLVLGIAINLAPLLYFKYTNFFLANLAGAAHLVGFDWRQPALNILLPLGISFFTFQGIAYLFDVAAGDEPMERLIDFMLFKAFWPQLIAGPIVRLDEMRRQIAVPRVLDYADVAAGSQRIIFGFFKKVALADNLAPNVEMVINSSSPAHAIDAYTAAIGFGMQIYFDFSAYSDIAIGTARLFGYHLPENFNWPYLSRSPREFWNRWHMTLSSWIRDYLFTPMSFAARRRPELAPIWLLIAMALCGLWHGAAWTFVLWGIWHGILLVADSTVLKRFFPPSENDRKDVPLWHALLGMIVTFTLVDMGWVLFRARSVRQAVTLLHDMTKIRGGLHPAILRENDVLNVALVFWGLLAAQMLRKPLLRLRDSGIPPWTIYVLRPLLYATLIFWAVIADRSAQAFIYFQF